MQFKINILTTTYKQRFVNCSISERDKVKLSVKLKGRERENPERAELIERVSSSVDCKVTKINGPSPIVILEP